MTGPEARFQSQVVKLAHLCGWLCYHTHDSRRSAPGFPDLTIARGSDLIFAELKATNGRVSGPQKLWIDELRRVADANPRVSVHIWTPSDWQEVERWLR